MTAQPLSSPPRESRLDRLTIVLPAYDEAERIGPALDELFGWLRSAPAPARRVDVLVVDDGSTDGTPAIVAARPEAAAPADAPVGLAVMTVPHGGKGAAVRAGMLAAAGEVAIFADADMATPPDQIPGLVTALDSADVALGSRIQPDGTDMRVSQPGYRRLLGRIFHLLAAAWVTGPVRDTQCGFKGFRREAAEAVFGRQIVTSIVFDAELIHLARRLGLRVVEVPVRWSDRRGSRMRPRPGLALRVAWDLVRIPLIHRGLRADRPAPDPTGR